MKPFQAFQKYSYSHFINALSKYSTAPGSDRLISFHLNKNIHTISITLYEKLN